MKKLNNSDIKFIIKEINNYSFIKFKTEYNKKIKIKNKCQKY